MITVIKLYRIRRKDNGTTITPIKPENYESELFRLIVDEGMELVNGDIRTTCIDTEIIDGWTEEIQNEEQVDD